MSRPRILIVEDNPATLEIASLALEAAGFEVLEAPDGATALELMASSSPDLVLQDLLLPDIDGLELVEKLRAAHGDGSVPILAVSGFLPEIEERRVLAAGFTDYVFKPVEPSRLVSVVKAVLPRVPDTEAEVGAGRRLLLVDDDPVQCKLARLHFESLGFAVETAGDGLEALEAARRTRPDAIVSDVLMPRLDGFELCLGVRTEPTLRNVPVVLASSNYVEEADADLARRAGADAYVMRTAGLEEVTAALLHVLGTERTTGPLAPEEIVRQTHALRLSQQLERQMAANVKLARLCALQSAELSVLSSISAALAGRRDLREALAQVLAACLDAAGLSLGVLYLLEADGSLKVRAHAGLGTRTNGNLGTFFGFSDVLQAVIAGGAPVQLPVDQAPRIAELRTALREHEGITGGLIVPLTWQGQGIGALFVAARSRQLLSDDAVAFAQAVAGQISQAVALSQLFEQVAQSEERFRLVVESMADVVYVLGRDLHLVATYGTDESGMPLPDLRGAGSVAGQDAAARHHAAAQAALGGQSVVYDWEFPGPSGTRFFQTRLSPIRNTEGEVTGLVGVGRELTALKTMQTQLLLSERLASVGTLAAGVAHEINNPLTVILASLELNKRRLGEGAFPLESGEEELHYRDEVRDAIDAAERIREIVRDLKLFSRGGEIGVQEAVDLHRVLDTTIRMANNEIRHRARLIREYGQIPPVQANESRLGQVFLNLIVNAAQAIPEGDAEHNRIRVSTRLEGGSVVISVADTGVGIAPEHLDRLFVPFFTTKPIGHGTGLGLSICLGIVESLGGRITVQSSVGRGSVFSVHLPGLGDSAEPAAPAERTSTPAQQRGAVLVIDDEPLVGRSIRRMLQGQHDVTVAASAAEALDLLGSGTEFDLVLCDLMMPQMTGMDFFAELATIRPDYQSRVVFLTGGAFTPRARAFLDEVPNERIEKPIGLQELRALVNARLSER